MLAGNPARRVAGTRTYSRDHALPQCKSGSYQTQISVENDTCLAAEAAQLAGYIRAHWTIENQVHWILDVTFREDDQRARVGYQPDNLAVLRRIALNLLKRETSHKRSIKSKRFVAALDTAYLFKVLQAGLA